MSENIRSDLNMICHPKQCTGCNDLVCVDDCRDINSMEYFCQQSANSEFFQDCKMNLSYTTGYFEGDAAIGAKRTGVFTK